MSYVLCLHVYTSGRGNGYTLHVHDACMKKGTPCMSIVHTPAVGDSERETPCLSIDG